jgi:hypothetical protein
MKRFKRFIPLAFTLFLVQMSIVFAAIGDSLTNAMDKIAPILQWLFVDFPLHSGFPWVLKGLTLIIFYTIAINGALYGLRNVANDNQLIKRAIKIVLFIISLITMFAFPNEWMMTIYGWQAAIFIVAFAMIIPLVLYLIGSRGLPGDENRFLRGILYLVAGLFIMGVSTFMLAYPAINAPIYNQFMWIFEITGAIAIVVGIITIFMGLGSGVGKKAWGGFKGLVGIGKKGKDGGDNTEKGDGKGGKGKGDDKDGDDDTGDEEDRKAISSRELLTIMGEFDIKVDGLHASWNNREENLLNVISKTQGIVVKVGEFLQNTKEFEGLGPTQQRVAFPGIERDAKNLTNNIYPSLHKKIKEINNVLVVLHGEENRAMLERVLQVGEEGTNRVITETVKRYELALQLFIKLQNVIGSSLTKVLEEHQKVRKIMATPPSTPARPAPTPTSAI